MSKNKVGNILLDGSQIQITRTHYRVFSTLHIRYALNREIITVKERNIILFPRFLTIRVNPKRTFNLSLPLCIDPHKGYVLHLSKAYLLSSSGDNGVKHIV